MSSTTLATGGTSWSSSALGPMCSRSDCAEPAMIPARVLVVDDEPHVRLACRISLETAGYEVLEASDGRCGLDKMRRAQPQLVLLDLRMPGMSGLEMLRVLRASNRDVAVLIISGFENMADMDAAIGLGSAGALTKPFTPRMLRTVVADVLAQRHSVQVGKSGIGTSPPVLDLTAAKRALSCRRFPEAERLLQKAIDLAPACAEALNLLGLVLDALGEHHAAYRSYRAALEADPQFPPALENMRLYCERNGFDFHNKAINPGAP